MTRSDPHPDLLAWVSGATRRDPGFAGEAGDVAAHLLRCDACRREEASLRSMRRSLRASREGGRPGSSGERHLSIEALLEIEAAGGAGAPVVRDSARRHVSECGACRADLDALLRAGRARQRSEGPAPSRLAGRPGRLAWAAVAAVVVAGIGILMLRPAFVPDASKDDLPSKDVVVFAAPSRAGAAERTLAGGAPATVHVILPFGAEGGEYAARLERAEGGAIGQARTRVLREGELIEARLDVPDVPGPYRLILEPKSGRGTPIVYPLRVVTGPSPPAATR